MATYRTRTGIDYDEVALPGFQLSSSSDAVVLVRTFSTAGTTIRQFLIDVIGHTILKGTAGESGMYRYPPLQDQEYTDLWATGWRFAQVAGPFSQHVVSKAVRYELVTVEVEFRNLRWWPLDEGQFAKIKSTTEELGRYVERREGFKVEASEVPTGSAGFRFKGVLIGGQPKVVPSPPAKLTQGGIAYYTWRQIPLWYDQAWNAWRLPTGLRNRLRAGTGRINSAAFDNSTWPAKSMYCPGPELEYHEMSNGQPAVHVHFAFDIRGGETPSVTPPSDADHSPQPLWDRVLNVEVAPGGVSFRQIETNDTNAEGPYATFDFKNLFSVMTYP